MTKETLKERAKMVRAMELIVRSINDESIFDAWLSIGVADGDITEDTIDEDLEYYCEDDNFADLMYLFLRLITAAKKSGGLYYDGIVSKRKEDD